MCYLIYFYFYSILNCKKQIILITTLIIFLIFWKSIISQELDPTVDVTLDKVNSDARDRLVNFKNEVTDYLAKTKFTNEDIINDIRSKPYKIKCNFSVFFTNAVGFDYYEAQVVITSQRFIYHSLVNYGSEKTIPLLRIKDESWQFSYIKGQGMIHDELRFNNLTSFLDYYAYLIIAYDDDSWELKLGTKRFQKAQDVVNLAVANQQTTGWADNTLTKASRNTYLSDILNSKYDNFRKAIWIYHFCGIDSIYWSKRQALDRIAQALELIGQVRKTEIRSFTIKSFFESKYLEIAQTMVDYYDKTIFKRLGEIDPDHVSTYDEYSRK